MLETTIRSHPGRYESWSHTFGQNIFHGEEDFIRSMCEMKMGGNPAGRETLRHLGFRDEDIAYYPMVDLWIAVIKRSSGANVAGYP
jgi:hypothetical protein